MLEPFLQKWKNETRLLAIIILTEDLSEFLASEVKKGKEIKGIR